jgi:hypothetical protein
MITVQKLKLQNWFSTSPVDTLLPSDLISSSGAGKEQLAVARREELEKAVKTEILSSDSANSNSVR